MASRNVLSKAVAGAMLAGTLSLTSLFSGVVSADTGINIGVGELQECTISKSMDMASPKLAANSAGATLDAHGDVDGRDFLVWQRGNAVPSQSTGGSDLADWQGHYGTGF